jgi:hypothetical protein
MLNKLLRHVKSNHPQLIQSSSVSISSVFMLSLGIIYVIGKIRVQSTESTLSTILYAVVLLNAMLTHAQFYLTVSYNCLYQNYHIILLAVGIISKTVNKTPPKSL